MQAAKRLIRIEEVKHKVGASRPWIYARIAADEFPRPVKLGAKASGWLESEIDAWIDARVAASRG